jgi:hypothetical protein
MAGEAEVRYRHLEISHGPGSKPDGNDLKAIERAVGSKLPPDFKAFLTAGCHLLLR